MSDTGCMIHKPTFVERFWRRVGFRYHLGEEPEAQTSIGWMKTDSYLQFGLFDRLRLLLTGKLFISTTVHMDTPSPKNIITRLDWMIKPPGDKSPHVF